MSGANVERAQLIGARKQLVGVVTEAVRPDSEAPLVVILNSGIIHRVGPNRLSVQLARALAEQGYRVLRFDLSGIGDSEPRADALAPLDAALADIREALDWAREQLHTTRFLLVGLCSGADHAVIYSGGDERIAGLVVMDPTVPPTPQFRLRQLLGRLANRGLWSRLLNADARTWTRVATLGRAAANPLPPRGPDPGQLEVRRYLENAYQQAMAGSRRMLAIFTDGLPAQHNYAGQLCDALPGVDFGGRLRVEYFHGSDHTFSDESHRDALIALLAQWANALTERSRT